MKKLRNAQWISSERSKLNSAPRGQSLLGALLPPPDSLVEAISEAALPLVEKELQQKAFEELYPLETVRCTIELRFALRALSKAPRYASLFEGDPRERYCRLCSLELNASDQIVQWRLRQKKVGVVRFFAALPLAKFLLRRQNALAAAMRAECLTLAGQGANSHADTTTFAQLLAKSALPERIEQLPIFGDRFESAVGRSFRLAELQLLVREADHD
jgi:hypothetical protein